MASSQGIVSLENLLLDRSPLAYIYIETGYNATVNCIKTSSSGFGLNFVESNPSTVAIRELEGSLPNSVPGNAENYPSVTWYDDTNLTAGDPSALVWAAVVNTEADNRNMIAIVAGAPYATLNQTQCTVTFNLQAFTVSVNVTEQSVIAAPCPNCTDIVDIEPLGRLMDDTI